MSESPGAGCEKYRFPGGGLQRFQELGGGGGGQEFPRIFTRHPAESEGGPRTEL